MNSIHPNIAVLQRLNLANISDCEGTIADDVVFNLLHYGKLLEDHYISHTRFRNIVRNELNVKA
ncbi:hypothetical protein J0X14_13110 [Muricauda sp. CAU 1633]|uniref:hypothetical protein n=1 Tax=Allomuricauda sp. CAU 1633 TaxID=2816036 RepID=UPI001A8E0845|nr:hypothetical protein [Muricauda sp. CAU 1633]MBO0323241.1 hypothetical protein [Muricauda sp. CAU 1633]